jgi:hypothetical protein
MILYHAGNLENIKNDNYNELGIHMGTKDTVEQIASVKGVPINKYNVDIKNPIEINDFPRWFWFPVAQKLLKMQIISDSEFKAIEKIKQGEKKDRELIKLLQSKGYDSFKYDNYFEGGGISYLIFDKNQISKPLKESKDYLNYINLFENNMNSNILLNNPKRIKYLNSDIILYHGSDNGKIKNFFNNVFVTTNDYIALNYAENMDGYVYICNSIRKLKLYKPSEEQKQQISKTLMGKKLSEETKRKISISNNNKNDIAWIINIVKSFQ